MPKPSQRKYHNSPETDAIMRFLPDWFSMKRDQNSVGWGFINAAFGQEMERLRRLKDHLASSTKIMEYWINEPSQIYKTVHQEKVPKDLRWLRVADGRELPILDDPVQFLYGRPTSVSPPTSGVIPTLDVDQDIQLAGLLFAEGDRADPSGTWYVTIDTSDGADPSSLLVFDSEFRLLRASGVGREWQRYDVTGYDEILRPRQASGWWDPAVTATGYLEHIPISGTLTIYDRLHLDSSGNAPEVPLAHASGIGQTADICESSGVIFNVNLGFPPSSQYIAEYQWKRWDKVKYLTGTSAKHHTLRVDGDPVFTADVPDYSGTIVPFTFATSEHVSQTDHRIGKNLAVHPEYLRPSGIATVYFTFTRMTNGGELEEWTNPSGTSFEFLVGSGAWYDPDKPTVPEAVQILYGDDNKDVTRFFRPNIEIRSRTYSSYPESSGGNLQKIDLWTAETNTMTDATAGAYDDAGFRWVSADTDGWQDASGIYGISGILMNSPNSNRDRYYATLPSGMTDDDEWAFSVDFRLGTDQEGKGFIGLFNKATSGNLANCAGILYDDNYIKPYLSPPDDGSNKTFHYETTADASSIAVVPDTLYRIDCRYHGTSGTLYLTMNPDGGVPTGDWERNRTIHVSMSGLPDANEVYWDTFGISNVSGALTATAGRFTAFIDDLRYWQNPTMSGQPDLQCNWNPADMIHIEPSGTWDKGAVKVRAWYNCKPSGYPVELSGVASLGTYTTDMDPYPSDYIITEVDGTTCIVPMTILRYDAGHEVSEGDPDDYAELNGIISSGSIDQFEVRVNYDYRGIAYCPDDHIVGEDIARRDVIYLLDASGLYLQKRRATDNSIIWTKPIFRPRNQTTSTMNSTVTPTGAWVSGSYPLLSMDLPTDRKVRGMTYYDGYLYLLTVDTTREVAMIHAIDTWQEAPVIELANTSEKQKEVARKNDPPITRKKLIGGNPHEDAKDRPLTGTDNRLSTLAPKITTREGTRVDPGDRIRSTQQMTMEGKNLGIGWNEEPLGDIMVNVTDYTKIQDITLDARENLAVVSGNYIYEIPFRYDYAYADNNTIYYRHRYRFPKGLSTEYGGLPVPVDEDNYTVSSEIDWRKLGVFSPQEQHFVWGALDEFGMLLNTERLPGEDNWSYRRRLLDVFEHPANATKQGIINGISRELGLDTYNVRDKSIFYLTHTPLLVNPTGIDENVLLPIDVTIASDYEPSGRHVVTQLWEKYPWDNWIEGSDFKNHRYSEDASGFICWRNEDGSYSRIIEFTDSAIPETDAVVTVEYYYWTGGELHRHVDTSASGNPLDRAFKGERAIDASQLNCGTAFASGHVIVTAPQLASQRDE